MDGCAGAPAADGPIVCATDTTPVPVGSIVDPVPVGAIRVVPGDPASEPRRPWRTRRDPWPARAHDAVPLYLVHTTFLI